ncbi:hypothetical protein PZ892_07245 [Sphingobacterium sp. WM]|uniref:hypothetical protein n=1 Tax=Sphingobacterium sp. WM TaxID=3031802 RepID=UPI00240D1416|nr:hypothetical protein [Sphingobacterium sp. WM]WFB65001.1 hypothetical protein PZ892_07245 [Sphingobacterium sp. WM]
MIEFKNRDLKFEVEDHLFWMYRVTYEIEMHINAVISLERLISANLLFSDISSDLIFYHNELALIRTAFILKNKTRGDEKHSLLGLQNFLDGKQVKTNHNSIKSIFEKISSFYHTYQADIDMLIKKRDAEAHEFKVGKQIKISNDNPISLIKQLNIVKEVRAIITELYMLLFQRDLPLNLHYPIDLYSKIYKHSIGIIASEVQVQYST